MHAVIILTVNYTPESVEAPELQRSLEHNVRDFVGIGGLQTVNEDAEIDTWESSVTLTALPIEPPLPGLSHYRVEVRDSTGETLVQFYQAENAGHAEEQALNETTNAEVISVCLLPGPLPT